MMNTITNPLTFTVPLSYEAHSLAQHFTKGIADSEKSKQVYLNTLAVYATNYYLEGMGFETDWENSDSRDTVAVKLANIADLNLKNIGKVECCYILPYDDRFEIAPEVMNDRIAYIGIKLNESLRQATILGYIQNSTQIVSIKQLQPLEDLLLYLSTLEVEALNLSEVNNSTTSTENFVAEIDTTSNNQQKSKTSELVSKLGNWLEGLVEEGWQNVEKLFDSQPLGLAFMNEVSVIRGQEIDLGIQLNKISVALITKVTTPETISSNEVEILMQIRPLKEMALPASITLQIKDTSEKIVLETTSRENDNWIQLAFSAEYGESFKAIVIYQDAMLIRNFAI